MEAFSLNPPAWTQTATHALQFSCPVCQATAGKAHQVWINRNAPVLSEEYQRKWQEFYQCECGKVWWAWSSDRPPSKFNKRID
jgi:hypothetical protein